MDNTRQKNSATLAGLVVLAAVGAGVWWARSLPASPSAGHRPAVSARQTQSVSAPAPGQVAPLAPGAVSGDEALPDVTLADGFVSSGDVRITLSLAPQPPVAFAKTRARVRAEASGSPAVLEGGTISFEMTMPMGDHRYSLVAGQDGWQEAEVTLPRCMSGNRRWFATVEGTVAGRPRSARFRLDLSAPQ